MTVETQVSTTVREATHADVPRLCELFDRFCRSGEYAQHNRAEPAHCRRFIEQLIAHDDSAVLVWLPSDRMGDQIAGMIGVSVTAYPYSGEPIGTELFWWLELEARGRGAGRALLVAAEQWVSAKGATHLLMIAPAQSPGVERMYTAAGYTPLETTWQKPMDWFTRHAPPTPIQERVSRGIVVHDAVLPDPEAYRAMALRQPFQAVSDGTVTFQRIAPCAHPALPMWITRMYPRLTPTLSFFRQSAAGQAEPHYIHTDAAMGDWTAIFYLTPAPPPGDGTLLWRSTETGWKAGVVGIDYSAAHWSDLTKWACWQAVEAQFNRLAIFRSRFYHSRALLDNYGMGDDARLIQVVFGTGVL